MPGIKNGPIAGDDGLGIDIDDLVSNWELDGYAAHFARLRHQEGVALATKLGYDTANTLRLKAGLSLRQLEAMLGPQILQTADFVRLLSEVEASSAELPAA